MHLNHLDKILVSHPHADHIGGIFQLLSFVSVDSVYLPSLPYPFHWQDSLQHVLQRRGIPHRFLQAGDILRVDASTRIYVLSPFSNVSEFKAVAGRKLNNHSLVLLVNYRGHRILFTGDVEKRVERFLRHWGNILHANVMKVPHHGAASSLLPDFWHQIHPGLAVISVGRKNRYGHPSLQTLSFFRNEKVPIKRTDVAGGVWIKWDKGHWRIVPWQEKVFPAILQQGRHSGKETKWQIAG